MIKETTKKTFTQDLSEGISVLDFFADWCMPCKMESAELAKLEGNNPGLTILKINTDKEMDLAEEFGITALPTLVFMKNGKELFRHVGFVTCNDLQKIIDDI